MDKPEITIGEMKNLLEHYPDDTKVFGYSETNSIGIALYDREYRPIGGTIKVPGISQAIRKSK